MSRREPWAVRLYRRAAWTIGDLSSDAADAFASLYADERRRGVGAAMRLWLRAMIDLLRAGAIVRRPRPFAAFGHDLRWAWRTLRTRPGVSLVVIASIGLAIGANIAAFVVAFSVRRRLPELGIRAALGARPADVRRFVLREAALLVVVGVASGATVSRVVRPWLDANLCPVGVNEAGAAILAGAGALVAGAISTIVPAARASRIDPVRALAGR